MDGALESIGCVGYKVQWSGGDSRRRAFGLVWRGWIANLESEGVARVATLALIGMGIIGVHSSAM